MTLAKVVALLAVSYCTSTCKNAVTPPSPAPDFTVSCPSQVTIDLTAPTATCTVASRNGFNSPVTLACSGLPAGVPCAFQPSTLTLAADVSLTSNLELGVAFTARPGSSTLQALGTAAGMTKTANIALTISAACAGFREQPSYTGSCANRPAGTICWGFGDGYVWLANDSFGASGFNVSPCDGKTVQVARGLRADYHHVLSTLFVKEVAR